MRERQGAVAPGARSPQPGKRIKFLSVPPAVASPSCSGLSLLCLLPIQVVSPLFWPVRTLSGVQDAGVLSPALCITAMWP